MRHRACMAKCSQSIRGMPTPCTCWVRSLCRSGAATWPPDSTLWQSRSARAPPHITTASATPLRNSAALMTRLTHTGPHSGSSPIKPRCLSTLATLSGFQVRLDEAAGAYRDALRIRPDFAEAQANLSVVLKDLLRFTEAVTACNAAIRIRPDSADFRYNLGNVLAQMGRYDDAATAYRTAVQIRPDFAQAHANMANALKEVAASTQRLPPVRPQSDSPRDLPKLTSTWAPCFAATAATTTHWSRTIRRYASIQLMQLHTRTSAMC